METLEKAFNLIDSMKKDTEFMGKHFRKKLEKAKTIQEKSYYLNKLKQLRIRYKLLNQ